MTIWGGSMQGSSRPANLFQLLVDFPLGTGRYQRGEGVENFQQPLTFALAQPFDAAWMGFSKSTHGLSHRPGEGLSPPGRVFAPVIGLERRHFKLRPRRRRRLFLAPRRGQ